MSGFKVGDKVIAISAKTHGWGRVEAGDIGKVKEILSSKIVIEFDKQEHWYAQKEDLKLYVPKRTKNERITSLEETVEQQQNEINELKVIVHQLRENGLPSTILSVEDESEIIEFEGAKYRKVNREAREGDVVIIRATKSITIKDDTSYPVVTGEDGKLYLKQVDYALVYDEYYNRTLETVDVYELIVQDKQPPFTLAAHIEPKSPNQLRAEIIEKAKGFVEDVKNRNDRYEVKDPHGWSPYSCIVEFIVNGEKRTIVALMRGFESNKIYARSIAKCHPNNVFNEHIGKAVALGRALGLDVSEFEQAVQPTFAVGQVVENKGKNNNSFKRTTFVVSEINGGDIHEGWNAWTPSEFLTIINDTNAIYSEVK